MKTLLKLVSLVILCSFAVSCSSSGKKSDMKKEDAKSDKKMSKSADKKDGEKSADAAGETLVCKVKGDERSLELVKADGGCELYYTKFGERKQVATAKWGTSYCEQVRDKVSGNLKNAGFSCE